MPEKNERPQTSQPEKGEIRAVTFGSKVITVKDRCTCGGNVHVSNDPETGGKKAECTRCGATLSWGGN